MYNTSTSIFSDEITSDDSETSIFLSIFKEIKQRLVGGTNKLLSLNGLEHFMLSNLSLLVDVSHSISLETQVFLAIFKVLELHVIEGRVDSTCQVGGKSPWGGGPGNEVSALEFS
jgi:hypothetical protein